MMRSLFPLRWILWLAAAGAFFGGARASRSLAAEAELTPATLGGAFQKEVRPLLERFCFDCHGESDGEGEINLGALADWEKAIREPRIWQKAAEMLGNGLMPPQDAEQPSEAERAKLQGWLGDYLKLEARRHAGDPGRVVLRRLSNAEYTYTLRDLTGVPPLDPAREFPADGAAGEGFTNTGNALVMSPALFEKYLDAAKGIADHAVLLPDGFRFSPHTTPRDWTNDLLADIRKFYAQFTVSGGEHLVAQQGVPLDVNMGGRIPLEKYFAATIVERDALRSQTKTIDAVARKRGLSAKYLQLLWASLNSTEPSLLLNGLRAKWRAANPGDEVALAAEVTAWQQGLFTYAGVGLIGRVGGPKRWLETVSPLASRQEFRVPLSTSAAGEPVVVSLVANDAGDGNEHDFVVWEQPRLVAAGRPDLLVRDVRRVSNVLKSRQESMAPKVAEFLAAADEVATSATPPDVAAIASKHGLETAQLQSWLNYLGVGTESSANLEGLFTEKLNAVGGHAFINGWGTDATPLVLANSSDTEVRIPGIMRPHGVCVHPSPTLRAATGWRSPISGAVRIDARVAVAHPECTNGVTWAIELRRGTSRQQLAGGVANQQTEGRAAIERITVREGDVVSLLVGPLDGNHSCDLTAVDFKMTAIAGDSANGAEVPGATEQVWDLGQDCSGSLQTANPHEDRFGNASVWHFYTEPERAGANESSIPQGSLLAQWQTAGDSSERARLSAEVQKLFASPPPADATTADSKLRKQLTSFGGPVMADMQELVIEHTAEEVAGPDPALFGKHPKSPTIDGASICVQAPNVVKLILPAEVAEGRELVTSAMLDPSTGGEGTAQVRVVMGDATAEAGLQVSTATVTRAGGQWSSDNRQITSTSPILVAEQGESRARVEAQVEEFRQLFPAALCYTMIVPVDEVVTLVLFYREDDHLRRLMLNEGQAAELERLWDELHFVSQDAIKQVDVLEQLLEYASQDADPKVFEPLRGPYQEHANAFRQRMVECEPKQVDALVEFAGRAFRRPLTEAEAKGLCDLYASLRQQEIPHEEAFRLTLARVFVSPEFLYRVEKPAAGDKQGPISDWELASRLSYFLWSSQPDDELRAVAAAGRLHEPEVLATQTKRMLGDAKARRLATEFGCQWLQINGFEQLDEKSDRHFPTFAALRAAMAEESTLFFTDLFQRNGSVLEILDADYTFLNEELAKHYGIPGVSGAEWRRVDGVKQYSRGGVLAHATTLAKQSGASRTSPILRGNWISEVILGEKLPKPPKGVPPLPDDEAATQGLSVRQLVEKHVSDPKCSVCHKRIDPYGFALEAFDAIGAHREKDLGGRLIETRTTTMDGTELEGLQGLRDYLVVKRRDAFVRQFCKKLLGYSLGRAVQLSDEPLLEEVSKELAANDYRIGVAVDAIVQSPQFREIRGAENVYED